MDSDVHGHPPCDKDQWRLRPLDVPIRNYYFKALKRLVQALNSGKKWEEASKDEEILSGMKGRIWRG